MINEERVRHMARMAFIDQDQTRQSSQIKEYYGSDYVGKEVLKSIFTGTIAFGLIVLLVLLRAGEDAIGTISSVITKNWWEVGKQFVFLYLSFEALYLLVTVMVYRYRYHQGMRTKKRYLYHLKKLNKLYAREEKIKA